MRIFYIIMLITAISLSGCAGMDNPFAQKPSNPEEVAYSQFNDIPVPKDMAPDTTRSFINYASDGSKTGLETLEGKIDPLTLSRVMINNMTRDGWHLRSTSSGAAKHMQLYERDTRYAVIYYYAQSFSNAMEIWISSKLADGVQPSPGSSAYSTPAGAPGSSSAGKLQERNLP